MQLSYQRSSPPQTASPVTLPPVVFLHAFPVDTRMWRAQIQALTGRVEVITLDMRGYGQTPADDAPFSIQMFAQDVLETLSALVPSVGPAIFIGCSMGGYVAFEIFRQNPKAVAGLVLCDTRAEADTPETLSKRREQIDKIESEGSEFFPRLMAQNVLAPVTREKRPDLVEEVKRWMSEPAADVLTRTLEALGQRPDSTATLATTNVPTLVIVGQQDTVTPRDSAERLRDGIPNAVLVEILDAGHLSPLENPAETNQAIDEWLSRHWNA